MPKTPNLFQLAAPSHHSLNIKIMTQDFIPLVDIICVEANTVINLPLRKTLPLAICRQQWTKACGVRWYS